MTCPACARAVNGALPLHSLCPVCLLRQAAETAPKISDLNHKIPSPGSLPSAFGPYDLLYEIGHGGMGVVFKARRRSCCELVAIKILTPGNQAPSECFRCLRAEAAAGAALQHPGIVSVKDIGVHEGRPYVVMDYVRGKSLADMVKSRPLPWRHAARYTRQTAKAIHYAHEHGLLHGDLKPSNILLETSGRPRITDFGLAQRLGTRPDLIRNGQVLGSPPYMPPEKVLAGRKLDRRTDVYGLGAVLYQLLTGRPPFKADTLQALFGLVLNAAPVSIRSVNRSVPARLEMICLKCLEKEPQQRFATAEELVEQLECVERQ